MLVDRQLHTHYGNGMQPTFLVMPLDYIAPKGPDVPFAGEAASNGAIHNLFAMTFETVYDFGLNGPRHCPAATVHSSAPATLRSGLHRCCSRRTILTSLSMISAFADLTLGISMVAFALLMIPIVRVAYPAATESRGTSIAEKAMGSASSVLDA